MFSILYDEAAEQDLRRLRAFERQRVLDEVDALLNKSPMTPTRRRKLLTGIAPPWNTVRPVWQLRIGEFRVFYDVDEERTEVVIRAVRRKGTKTTKETL
jgi:mRNA-degrading endonuclease RelE of RelBE toxin-antitoxin system